MESRRADNILLSPAIAIQKVCSEATPSRDADANGKLEKRVRCELLCLHKRIGAVGDELVRVCVLQSVAISFRLGSQLAAFVCLCNECQPLFYTKPSR